MNNIYGKVIFNKLTVRSYCPNSELTNPGAIRYIKMGAIKTPITETIRSIRDIVVIDVLINSLTSF